ncbi:MAG: D-tyrosyl-tRNA(Tyr) deacylase [Bacilli bacterium]|nr:D-tyrosyl-tRNA(Tyr) deacylase [Bacilli bacterium]
MRVVLQRVSEAQVKIDGELLASIGAGYLLLVGFTHTDSEAEIDYMANKIAKLRVFSDSQGKMNLSIKDTDGEILAVSQFTLYGNAEDGNRPSFTASMKPDIANTLYDTFLERLYEATGKTVKSGRFKAHMAVELTNDGPVTIILER